MKIFHSDSVREIDEFTIQNEPIANIDLMERAASRLKDWFVRRYRVNRRIMIFAGPGNNGGDALALARMLAVRQYRVECFLVTSSGKRSPNGEENLKRLKETGLVNIRNLGNAQSLPALLEEDVVVDGLFGSGLTRPVDGLYRDVIRHINHSASEVVAVDIPSGLFGEDNTENDDQSIIQADFTLTFQFPFLSFFFSENEVFTGEWIVLDIGLHPEIIGKKETRYSMITRDRVAGLLPERPRFAHKGVFGHALAVAGSSGMMGAALLSGEAALRTGAGLVTLHVPASGFKVVQTAFPEAIVSIDSDADVFSELPDLEKYAAVAVGPGLGNHEKSREALQLLLETITVPLVVDADAINMIAGHREMLSYLPEGSILTPHPLEFDRLAGSSTNGWSRHLAQISFSLKYHVTVVLKGAYTSVSFPDGNCVFNSTGNPGMATGGSGDVLTGIILSLLAQRLLPENAALAGVYLHGLAGDKAAEKYGEESMIAGDIFRCLGDAFRQVKSRPFVHEGRKGGVSQ